MTFFLKIDSFYFIAFGEMSQVQAKKKVDFYYRMPKKAMNN